MFERARLRLTAYYIVFLIAVLGAFDIGVVGLTASSLTESVQAEIHDKADRAAQAVVHVGSEVYVDASQVTADPSWSDVVCYIATREGTFDCPASRTARSVLPERTSLAQGMSGRASFTRVGSGPGGFAIYTRPVYGLPSAPGSGANVVAVVQVGRSTRTVFDAVKRLTELLAGASLLALALTLVAGSWLAGKTLEPIRVSLEHQKQFAGDASHELRTPITVIQTAAEAILRGRRVDRRTRDLVGDILAENEQLARLVEELSALAAHDTARARPLRDDVDVADLFADATASGRHLAERAGVRLEAHLEGNGTIVGDPARARQLLSVLLDNATKFSPPGAVVSMIGHAGDRRLVIRIVDRGPGIPEEDLPRIFERFYRGAADRQREGTGLGLAIARALVDEFRGSISVRSRVGEGSEFVVDVPLSGRRERVRAPRPAVPAEQAEPDRPLPA